MATEGLASRVQHFTLVVPGVHIVSMYWSKIQVKMALCSVMPELYCAQ